jgi:hypothetical protein
MEINFSKEYIILSNIQFALLKVLLDLAREVENLSDELK